MIDLYLNDSENTNPIHNKHNNTHSNVEEFFKDLDGILLSNLLNDDMCMQSVENLPETDGEIYKEERTTTIMNNNNNDDDNNDENDCAEMNPITLSELNSVENLPDCSNVTIVDAMNFEEDYPQGGGTEITKTQLMKMYR